MGTEGSDSVRAAVEREVLAEYERVKGQVVLLSRVDVAREGGEGVEAHLDLDPPVPARILPYQDGQVKRDSLFRWADEAICDPIYDVEVLEEHPALEGWRAVCCYGSSRHIDGGPPVAAADFEVADAEVAAKYAPEAETKPTGP